MTLGTGIFLSVLIGSFLILYLKTRDRWNWKRFRSWVLTSLSLIIILTGVFAIYDELKNYINNYPRAITEYHQIKLGMARDEVRYLLDDPTDVLDKPNEDGLQLLIPIKEIKNKIENFAGWHYDYASALYPYHPDIRFENDKVSSISCYSKDRGCIPFSGLEFGSNENEFKDKLGKPSKEKIDDGVKILSYEELNLVLFFQKQQLYYARIMNLKKS